MCPNPVPHTETNGPHNHCRFHHVLLSDGKTPFLTASVCSVLHFPVATLGGKVETDQKQLEELVWITQTMVYFRHTLWLDITSQPQSIMTSSGQCHIVSWHSSWLVSDTSLLSIALYKLRLREERTACSTKLAHPGASNNCFTPLGLAIDYYDGGKDPVSKTPFLLHSSFPLPCYSSELEVRKSSSKDVS